jgi:hypothetical protein
VSLQVPAGKLESNQVLTDMARLINGRQIALVHLAGVLDQWSDKYFDQPLFTGTGAAAAQNYPSLPEVTPPNALAWAVVGILTGFDVTGALPTISTETRKGAFKITL